MNPVKFFYYVHFENCVLRRFSLVSIHIVAFSTSERLNCGGAIHEFTSVLKIPEKDLMLDTVGGRGGGRGGCYGYAWLRHMSLMKNAAVFCDTNVRAAL